MTKTETTPEGFVVVRGPSGRVDAMIGHQDDKPLVAVFDPNGRPAGALYLAEDGEAELPTTRISRQIDVLKSAYQDAKAFGPAARAALRETREQQARALAFKRMGYEQSLWFDLIEEDEGVGKASRWELAQALASGINILDVEREKERILYALKKGTPIAKTPWTWKHEAKARRMQEARARLQPPPPETPEQMRTWRIAQGLEEAAELSGAAEEVRAAAGELSGAARELRGGPTLRRPNDDL